MKKEKYFDNEELKAMFEGVPTMLFVNDFGLWVTDEDALALDTERVAYFADHKAVIHFDTTDVKQPEMSLDDFATLCTEHRYMPYDNVVGYAFVDTYSVVFDTDEEAREYIEELKDWGYYGDIIPYETIDKEYQKEELLWHIEEKGYSNY